jgi:hypothetical protein
MTTTIKQVSHYEVVGDRGVAFIAHRPEDAIDLRDQNGMAIARIVFTDRTTKTI